MKKTKSTFPVGYRCTSCNADHEYPAYVYAHWTEEIVHTCSCGSKHSIVRGAAKPWPSNRVIN